MKDFTKGNIPRLMLSFLVPMLLVNTLQALYMLIDAVWAGQLLGSYGVAIIATGMPVIFLLSSFIAGIVVGAAILAGQAFGSGNHKMLSDIISTSLIGTVAVSLLISIPGIVFCGPLLKLINTPPGLLHGARVFLTLIIAGMTLSALGQWFASMLNATGDSRTPLKILLITLALNAILAPILITGAKLFHPLGIAGSALSTIISNIVGIIICYLVWYNHKLSKIAPLRFKIHLETLRKIIAVGFPLSLQMIIVSSSFMFILSLANKFGQDVTAAFGIGNRVDQFSFLATFAVTAAISAMTAQNIGAGKIERIPEIARWGLIMSLGITLFFSVSVILFPDTITSIFTREPAVMGYARHYLRVAGFSYLALAFLFAYQGVLRGAGDTFGSFIMISCSMIFLRVPLCYILSHYTSLRETGLWVGILISAIAGALAFYLYYKGGRWKVHGSKFAQKEAEQAEPILPELP
jgi:putative MATE family efflux protein